MAKKTNKTSHVLNLITNGASADSENQGEESPLVSESEQKPAEVVSLETASEEHAAALRDNTAALRESAAAMREAAAPMLEAAATAVSQTVSQESQEDQEKPENETVKTDSAEQEVPIIETPDTPPQEIAMEKQMTAPIPSGDRKVIVVDETTENDKLSNEIMNRLAEEVEAMEENSEQAAVEMENEETPQLEESVNAEQMEETTESESSEMEHATEEEESIQIEDANETEEEKEQVSLSPEELEETAEPQKEEEAPEEKIEEQEYHMVNVIEQIIQRKDLIGYMRQYGVCECSRCKADVEALVLTRLPAKYVVVDKSSVAPIIGYYENKFKVAILAEIVKACLIVKEHPRHNQEVSPLG